jgi:hypothetical protein
MSFARLPHTTLGGIQKRYNGGKEIKMHPYWETKK